MEENFPKRKDIRLKNYDYSTPGAYFITICTENRSQILSQIVGGDVLDAPNNVRCELGVSNANAPIKIKLSAYGKIADKYINQLNDFYDDIKVDRYVIMPNHIHIMLFVGNGASRTSALIGASRTSPPTRQHSLVSRFISTFKRFCNKEYEKNIWQRNFNDHIIRNK